MQVDTCLQQLGIGTEAYAHTVLLVIEAKAHHSTVCMHRTVEEGTEHKLRIALVVLCTEEETDMTPLDAAAFGLGQYLEIKGIEKCAVTHERMDVAVAVDARFRRGAQVDSHLFVANLL